MLEGKRARRRALGAHVMECATCERFEQAIQPSSIRLRFGYREIKGVCGICKDDDCNLSPYVPPLMREFFLTGDVCLRCKTLIREVVNEEWGLCWQASPDALLKWAMLDWIAGFYWREHFTFALEGHATGREFYTAMAKREGWYSEREEEVVDERPAMPIVIARAAYWGTPDGKS